MTALARGARTRGSGGLKIGRPSFLWSLPAITYFAIFAIVPLGVVVWLSFTDLGRARLAPLGRHRQLVGVFNDPMLIQSFKVTAILTVLGIVTQTPISLLLGVWAAGNQRNRAVLSALYFIPLLMSAAAISIVWVLAARPVLRAAARAALAVRQAIFGHGYLFSSPADRDRRADVRRHVAVDPVSHADLPGRGPRDPGGAVSGRRDRRCRACPAVLQHHAAAAAQHHDHLDRADDGRRLHHVRHDPDPDPGRPGHSTTSTSYYMYVKAFKSFEFGAASVIAVLLIVVATT